MLNDAQTDKCCMQLCLSVKVCHSHFLRRAAENISDKRE